MEKGKRGGVVRCLTDNVLSRLKRGFEVVYFSKSFFSIILSSLLIGQIVSGISISYEEDIFPNNDSFRIGNEIIIGFEDVISPKDWGYIEKLGGIPLRLNTHHEMVVWHSNPEIDFEGGGISYIKESGIADFLGPQNYEGDVKIIFEPRMKLKHVKMIISVLENKNYVLESIRNGDSLYNSYIGYNMNKNDIDLILTLPGILWVEGVFETKGRNGDSSKILTGGDIASSSNNLAWELGLNAEGIIVGVADTGIDRDHVCFRNSTNSIGIGNEEGDSLGTPGINHRKIILLNDTEDDWDYDSHTQGGHGTHVIGSLSCYDVYEERGGGGPSSNMTALGYNSKLIVQDIVNQNGWIPPNNIDLLLYESAINGAVINSYSWGDDTTEYTLRSHDLDAWARENPWSIAFIAPGNTGSQLLEPANARSVVAVGASSKDGGFFGGSSIGTTPEGTRGIFMVAPGKNIISANSDGISDSFNNESITMTGTSMATPMGASYASVIQQLVEDGWIAFYNENKTNFSISDISPSWVNGSNDFISLGDGFTPSNGLLRALIAISSKGLNGSNYQSTVVGVGPDEIQGWGQPSLNNLIDLNQIKNIRDNGIENENYSVGNNLWIWDSYRLTNNNWSEIISERVENSENLGTPLDRLIDSSWDGYGAVGPFISTNDIVSWEFNKENYDEDIEIVLSWTPKPYPEPADNLRLILEMSDGSVTYGSNLDQNGWSKINYDCEGVLYGDNTESCVGGEVTSTIRISKDNLGGDENIDWVRVSVEGVAITSGPEEGSVGINGNKIGFALAMKGVGEEINFSSVNKLDDFFNDDLRDSWGNISENLKGGMFNDGWEYFMENTTELWPKWLSENEYGKTKINPLNDGMILFNLDTESIYGVSKEEFGISSLTENSSGGLTFSVGDLLDLDNVTINALKINVISEDINFGILKDDIVVGVGNSNSLIENCCNTDLEGDYNTIIPDENISWKIGKVITDFNQSDFLFAQIRWPSEFSGNLSLEISIKSKDDDRLFLLTLPISIIREIDGEINEVFIGGVLEWRYDNGVNISLNTYDTPTNLTWNFSKNPGTLDVVVDLTNPRTLGAKIIEAERGLVEYQNSVEGLLLPYCTNNGSYVEEMGGIKSIDASRNSVEWVWGEVWLPHILWDCKGNYVQFIGELEMGVPQAISDLNWEIKDIREYWVKQYLAYNIELNLSNLIHPWLNAGLGDAPSSMDCKLKLKNITTQNDLTYQSINCDSLDNNLINMDYRISHLEFEFSWEEGGLERIYSTVFKIETLDVIGVNDNQNIYLPLDVSILKNKNNIDVKWGNGEVPEKGWPVFIHDGNHDFSHVFVLNQDEIVSIETNICDGDFEFYNFEVYIPSTMDLNMNGNSITWEGDRGGSVINLVYEKFMISFAEYDENLSFRVGKNNDEFILLAREEGVLEINSNLFKLGESTIMFECNNVVIELEQVEMGDDSRKFLILIGWVFISIILILGFIIERRKLKKNNEDVK